jgi:hypothetical protein
MLRLLSPIVVPRWKTEVAIKHQVTVGTAPSNELVLPMDLLQIGNAHAVISYFEDGIFVIESLGQNITKVNGAQIQTKVLMDGDVITFGAHLSERNSDRHPFMYVFDGRAKPQPVYSIPHEVVFPLDEHMKIFTIKDPDHEIIDIVTNKLCDDVGPLSPPLSPPVLETGSYNCLVCHDLLLLPHAYEACGHCVCLECTHGSETCPCCTMRSIESPAYCKMLDQLVQTRVARLTEDEARARAERMTKPPAKKRKRDPEMEVCVLQHTRLGRRFEAYKFKCFTPNSEREVYYNTDPTIHCTKCEERVECGLVACRYEGGVAHATCLSWPVRMVPKNLKEIRVDDARFCLHA